MTYKMIRKVFTAFVCISSLGMCSVSFAESFFQCNSREIMDADELYIQDQKLFQQYNILNKECVGREILFPSAHSAYHQFCHDADFSHADLSSMDLHGLDLRNATLIGANLSCTDLSGADLGGANMRGANLNSANLSGANLRGTDLRRANLNGANLTRATASGADMRGARTIAVRWVGARLYKTKVDPDLKEYFSKNRLGFENLD